MIDQNVPKYPKIHSIFKRDEKTKYATFLEEYSIPEFEILKDLQWVWTEKVDGTNIRLHFNPERNQVWVGGRTEKSQMPIRLLDFLTDFCAKRFSLMHTNFDCPVTFFGEGYGPGINSGGKYRKDLGFILFDILIGHYWLTYDSIKDIGNKLVMDVVPLMFKGSLYAAVEEMKKDTLKHSLLKHPSGKDLPLSEGIVGKPPGDLQTRMNRRIITKLKHSDFK